MIVLQATEESNVALAVRSHRTLELAGDNFYVITCGRSGWRDSATNESTTVRLLLTSGDRKITEATYGRDYELRAEMDAPSGERLISFTMECSQLKISLFSDKYGIKVRNCFAFSDKNSSVRLLNNNGYKYLFIFMRLFIIFCVIPSDARRGTC